MFDTFQNISLVFPWLSEGYSGLFDICQTDYIIHSKLRISLLFESHKWKYNIQGNKTLTKIKEK